MSLQEHNGALYFKEERLLLRSHFRSYIQEILSASSRLTAGTEHALATLSTADQRLVMIEEVLNRLERKIQQYVEQHAAIDRGHLERRKMFVGNGVLTIILLSTLFIAWLLIRRVSTPLKRINQAMLQLTQGSYSAQVQWPYSDEFGSIACFFDQMVTAIKQANEKIEEQFKQSSSIIQSMSEGLVVVDRQGIVRRVNEKMLEMLGREESEVLGKSVGLFFLEQEADQDQEVGVLALASSRLQRIHDANHDEFHQLLLEAPVPILVADLNPEHRPTLFLVNQEMETLLGYPPEALKQFAVEELLMEESRERVIEQLERAGGSFNCLQEGEKIECSFKSRAGSAINGTICVVSILCGGSHHSILMLKTASMMGNSLLQLTPFGKLFVDQESQETFGRLSSDRTLLKPTGEALPVHISGALLQRTVGAEVEGL